MDPQLALWILARAAGIASYAALCIGMLTGLALRTTVLDFLAEKKPIRALHDFTAWIWLPFGIAHVVGLILDKTARISVADAFVPFVASYGQLAIGLGTLSLDLMVLVVVTSWLRKRMNVSLWRAIHRLSYGAFALAFAHSILAGTDFGAPVIAGLSWASAAGLAYLTVVRMRFGPSRAGSSGPAVLG